MREESAGTHISLFPSVFFFYNKVILTHSSMSQVILHLLLRLLCPATSSLISPPQKQALPTILAISSSICLHISELHAKYCFLIFFSF